MCEFCGAENEVSVVSEEVPTSEEVTFVMSPPPVVAGARDSVVEDSLVVFCVDISGSMCVTTEPQVAIPTAKGKKPTNG